MEWLLFKMSIDEAICQEGHKRNQKNDTSNLLIFPPLILFLPLK